MKAFFGVGVWGGVRGGNLRLSTSRGTGDARETIDSDSASVTQLVAEFMPHFGPFGTVYFGPIVWAEYMKFSKSSLTAEDSDGQLVVVALRSGLHGGLGGGGGLILGRDANLELMVSVRFKLQAELSLFAGFGAGYRF